MEHEHKPATGAAEAARAPSPDPTPAGPEPSAPASAPASTLAGKSASAGAWEADGGLTDAMGLTAGKGGGEAPTIYRDLAPGASGDETGGDAVDAALANVGRGAAHASGASIHTDGTASAAAAELGAAAFTAGSDIFFGAGQYNPGTEEGDALLTHELAHVEQTRGLAAPTPGNYRVSDPDDAAEVAARDAEHGGAAGGEAAAGTIHRKGKNDKKGGKAADAGPDKLQEFFDALAANNAADAKAKWGTLAAADKARMRKAKVAKYPGSLKPDPVESVIEIMAKDGLPIMKDVGAVFDKLAYSDAVLKDAGHDAAYWAPALRGASMYDAWLKKLPAHAALTEARLTKLDPWMTEAAAVGDAKKVFQQAYPKLMDKTYNAAILKAAAWGVDDVKRMWKSLQGKVPLAHAQTITGGFNLGTDENLSGKKWKVLKFGWHHPGFEVIVMPKNSSTAAGGGTSHDMTGGSSSGVAVAGTAADPSITHWDGTMLHEIGHGVGAKTDGNSFAKKHGDWKGNQGWDAWSQKLFDDAAATKALPTPPPKKVLATKDARQFLAKEVAGGSYLPKGWTRDKVVDFINAHYKDEKLVKYWTAVKGGTQAYYATADNISGDRTYVWLERGGLNYTSYKKEISQNKVSWYSISSTVEWFAEQYANYYRTGKAGTGSDADTKKKLDEIDKMDATAKGGLKAAKAAPGTGGEAAAAAGGHQDGEQGTQDASAGSAEAEIRRMNFD
jgi:hypothetical protein